MNKMDTGEETVNGQPSFNNIMIQKHFFRFFQALLQHAMQYWTARKYVSILIGLRRFSKSGLLVSESCKWTVPSSIQKILYLVS